MFKIPFSWMPGFWGLKGKTRDIAQAEYELTGCDLEKRILEIKKDPFDSDKNYEQKLLEINLRYNKITRSEYDHAIANLIDDVKLKERALLDLDFKEGKITELAYAKQSATLNNEPWVTVLSMDFSGKNSLEGSFELDWNEFFVDKLKGEGYTAITPDKIVNQWFMEVCRNVALEEFDGTGDFTADSEANLETMKRWNNETESFGQGRKGYK